MVDFNGFDKGVIGRKLPSDSTLNQMKKSELIELLHLAESNHRVLAEAYKIAVDTSKCKSCPLTLDEKDRRQVRADAIKEYKQSEEYIKECVQRYLKGRADIQSEIMDEVAMLNETKMTEGDLKCFAYRIKAIAIRLYEQNKTN